ncbi:MAG: carboxylate-amine ligase [Nodosilinea sp.]
MLYLSGGDRLLSLSFWRQKSLGVENVIVLKQFRREPMADTYTLGVEEEYQLVDPGTRELCGRAGRVLAATGDQGDRVQPELHRCQIEIATSVCKSLGEVREELVRSRQVVFDAAAEQKVAVVAAGTHPFSPWQEQTLTDKARYRRLAQDMKQVIRELIIFGCHVHVGLNGDQFRSEPELALEVVNRCRLWLAPLLALTANSPFWEGKDTGYDSFRTELWCRLPTAGPPPYFTDYPEYDAFLQALIQTNVIQDATTVYWDIRLSENFPTIEFRITDVCLTIDEAVMLAGLIKALVRTCRDEAIASHPYDPIKSELLKAAHWTAARYGLSGDLIDLQQQQAISAKDGIQQLMTYLKPALEAEGDWDTVNGIVQNLLAEGNSASRQRQWYKESGTWEGVVDRLIEQTAKGLST